ncbi:MAG: chemotaxis response regulator protein-glutamate methylesterase [Idiomarina sp.]|nr:chemotaxis response regulator protein-glutamate methylesterase [Idiomarina sp.]
MTVRVLVVDDSSFFRRRVSEILAADPDIEVIGTAADGAIAVEQTKALRPDVITMDIEMPVLDGISAVRQIMASCPTPILMFSSLTHDGARATLDALEAGALDFLPKKFEDIARNRDEATHVLQQRVKAIGRKRVQTQRPAPGSSSLSQRSPVPPTAAARNTTAFGSRPATPAQSRTAAPRPSTLAHTSQSAALSRRGQPESRATAASVHSAEPAHKLTQLTGNSRYKLLAIGTSTGGPVALQSILTQLPANFPYPIVLVQHMPAAFTKAFAQRLNGLCKIEVCEAADGDILRPGVAYLAPGGMQMLADGRSAQARLRIRSDDSDRITYRPSVDLTFASLSKVYGGDVLGVILTGMGADGREGCRMLRERGATIWAQDQESCVVYGMPQAVTSAGIATQSYPLNQMAAKILAEVGFSAA